MKLLIKWLRCVCALIKLYLELLNKLSSGTGQT